MSDSGSTPPGWYHAQGDPEGTQRYWDGGQWVGSPQPAVGTPVGTYAAQPLLGGGTPAQLGDRVVAYLIDFGLTFAVAVVSIIVAAILGAVNDTLGALGVLLYLVAIVGFSFWNIIVRQGQTGQTLGKAQKNIKLVALSNGQPVGIGGAVLRALVATAFGLLCGVGQILDLLWPFWDQNRQRLTDKILKYNVVQA